MKNKLLKLLPFSLLLAFLSFWSITMWSYGIVIDGTDEFLYGFPFIYKCRGFHTSLSTQYFILEAIINFLVYLSFWTLAVYLLTMVLTLRMPKKLTTYLVVLFTFLALAFVFQSIKLNDMYFLYRDFDVVIFDHGISFFGSHPDYGEYSEVVKEWIDSQHQN